MDPTATSANGILWFGRRLSPRAVMIFRVNTRPDPFLKASRDHIGDGVRRHKNLLHRRCLTDSCERRKFNRGTRSQEDKSDGYLVVSRTPGTSATTLYFLGADR